MGDAALTLLGLAGSAAVGNWVAVSRELRWLELACKPATTALLLAVAVALEPADPLRQQWFVGALGASLAGDVLLMLRGDRFLAGVAAFAIAHVAYIAGLLTAATSLPGLAFGIGLAGALGALIGARVLARAVATSRELAVPLSAYLVAASGTVVVAGASGLVAALVGAVLFYLSDALIGWHRFVTHLPWAPVTIMVTYHLAQLGLVLSLLG